MSQQKEMQKQIRSGIKKIHQRDNITKGKGLIEGVDSEHQWKPITGVGFKPISSK